MEGDWEEIDQLVGEWYQAGFHGQFGTQTSGFFHEIGPPMVIDDNSVTSLYGLWTRWRRGGRQLATPLGDAHMIDMVSTV